MARIEGMAELKNNLRKFKNRAEDVIADAIFHGCVMIQNESKVSHPYKDRTGNLTNSIQALKPEIKGKKIRGEVIAGMEYATSVELGTGKSRPYPFLFPALEKKRRAINREIMSLIRKIRWVN